MTEKLTEQDNYILHTAITKITRLERKTSELEEKQNAIAGQIQPGENESLRLLIQELLATEKENSVLFTAVSEEQKKYFVQLVSISDQVKSVKSSFEQTDSNRKMQFDELRKLVLNSPRDVVQEKRILLFPEHRVQEYYAVFKWILYIIIVFLTFFLLKYLISCLFHLA